MTRRAFGLTFAAAAGAAQDGTMNILEFQERLARMRRENYRLRKADLKTGFRPLGGTVADFGVAEHKGSYHFFYIERRLSEGTPFYPGHEIYLGHASTATFVDWQVHDPVMLVRPGTWEGGHVWAPSILQVGSEYVMAYTGVSEQLSQDIGLASSTDLFEWKRWPSNPIGLCKLGNWAAWRADGIASCRDAWLFRHDGRFWMTYTANTREPAPCIALASSGDLRAWKDHGPILTGPAGGYEPRLQGGHPQGSIESSTLVHRRGRWRLLVHWARRGSAVRNWVFESTRMDRFDVESGREFWAGAYTTEIVKKKGDLALVACAGQIRFGEVNWADANPQAKYLTSEDQLSKWRL